MRGAGSPPRWALRAVAGGSRRRAAGVAVIVAEFMEALDLRDVVLVGNDTGGAICQILISEHPERVGRLVLTNCDAYEAFFPWPFRFVQYGARLFGERFVGALARVLRARAAQRLLMWTVSRRRAEEQVLDAYFGPLLRDSGVRRDLARFLRGVSGRHTLRAARTFPGFRRPVLIAWGDRDLLFPLRLARRLQRDFPDAVLKIVPGSRAFVPEDAPERLAEEIEAFIPSEDESGGSPRGARGAA
ncbi:alpha/beta fold hydrolase [Rubrobacter marinus]|uniref:alpha/beta fold hydrolase n=1 Tax=Rubrobacter marinus TaxID=2653852 RepID=UPI001A9CD4FC|nr:alpha/beta fold hydrolase [Rubrobacter marinus]